MAEKILFKEYLMEQIRHRYAPVGKISDDNEIIANLFNDEFDVEEDVSVLNENINLLIPELLGDYQSSHPKYLETKNFWKVMKKSLPESLEKIKKIKSREIESLIKKINKKHLKLCFVGFGGANSNLLYNMGLISRVNNKSIVDEIYVIEPENWAFTNILRVGKPVLDKARSRFSNLAESESFQKIETIDETEKSVSSDYFLTEVDYLTKEKILSLKEEGYIFIGAPDFSTRNLLQECDADFLMIGHSGNSIRITKNPTINGAVVETYGSIDIGILLMNLWAATFNLLDILANQNVEEIVEGTELFSFDFDSNFSEEDCIKIKKKYKKELTEIKEFS